MMSSRTFMVDVICTSVVDARLFSPRCIFISIDDLCSHACVRGIITHQTLSGTSKTDSIPCRLSWLFAPLTSISMDDSCSHACVWGSDAYQTHIRRSTSTTANNFCYSMCLIVLPVLKLLFS